MAQRRRNQTHQTSTPRVVYDVEVSLESLDDSERVETSAASDYLRRRISRREQQRVGREFGKIAGLESTPPPTSRPKTSMQAAGLITL